MMKDDFWDYLLLVSLSLLFCFQGNQCLQNIGLEYNLSNILICLFCVLPLAAALLVPFLKKWRHKAALWISLVLGISSCCLIWMNYFSKDFILNQTVRKMENETNDSILVGNHSYYQGQVILDCYREDAPEYHFKAYGKLFKMDQGNLHSYRKTIAAELIDDYLESVINEELNVNVRLNTDSLHMGLNQDAEFTSPVKLIESTKSMHLYCIAKSDASPTLIDDVAEIITPYLWNTNCVLIVIYHDNPDSVNLYSSDFYKIPRIQKKIIHN